MELKSVEDTSWLQLFIKNTALCKHESGRIRCDACPYTSDFSLAETCVFAKQSLGPALCDPTIRRAPLLPKLRGHFAEFLNEGSPARLRILSSPTCVGLQYGHPRPP